MPYQIEQFGKNKYGVVNTETGFKHSSHSTLENAEKQLRLLLAIDHGFTPNKKKINLYNKMPKKHTTHTVHHKMHHHKSHGAGMTTWREFYASKTRGKHFSSQAAVHAHMKAVAAEWRHMKGKGLYVSRGAH